MGHDETQLNAYREAQRALADLKAAVLAVVTAAGVEGLANSQVGRLLGIYHGHVGHEGHVSRTILELLKSDGVVEQDGKGGRWRVVRNPPEQ